MVIWGPSPAYSLVGKGEIGRRGNFQTFCYEARSATLTDSPKVTKLAHGLAETRTRTLHLLARSSVTKAGRRGDPPISATGARPRLQARPAPPPAAGAPPGGARAGRAGARRRLASLCGGSRAAGAEARSREGAGPSGGGATRGAGAAGPAGWGWMGGAHFLGPAVRMSRPPPGTPQPRRRCRGGAWSPPCLRRPQPESGPSPPVPGAGRTGGRGR